MAEASIPVDLRNPGQVFACLGLMEAAHALHPEPQRLRREPVTGRYEWDDGAAHARFTLSAPGEGHPVGSVVAFLSKAVARRWRPENLAAQMSKADAGRDVEVRDGPGAHMLPYSPPDGIARLPVYLTYNDQAIQLEYWGDAAATGLDDAKFWAGNVTGYSLVCDALGCCAMLCVIGRKRLLVIPSH